MSNRPQTARTTTLTNAAESGANTETVVCTLTPVTCEFPGQTVRLRGWFKGTTAAGTTSGLIRIRRTSLTGTVVSEATPENQGFAASKTSEATVNADDTPGELAGGTYVLTYVGAGEAGACTFLAASLESSIF